MTQCILLAIWAACFNLKHMRQLFAVFAAFLATQVLTQTLCKADPNTQPANVGLYNYSTFTVSTSTSIPIIPRNTARMHFFMQNQGSVSIVVKPGSVPANATDGIVLIAGASWEPNVPFVDAFYGISASSTAKIVMIEGIK